MSAYRPRAGQDWQQQEKQMRAAGTREGSNVQVLAPAGTAGAVFNGQCGVIAKFNYGWVTVTLPHAGDTRFRPDELVVL